MGREASRCSPEEKLAEAAVGKAEQRQKYRLDGQSSSSRWLGARKAEIELGDGV
jgi:hypothetical protein